MLHKSPTDCASLLLDNLSSWQNDCRPAWPNIGTKSPILFHQTVNGQRRGQKSFFLASHHVNGMIGSKNQSKIQNWHRYFSVAPPFPKGSHPLPKAQFFLHWMRGHDIIPRDWFRPSWGWFRWSAIISKAIRLDSILVKNHLFCSIKGQWAKSSDGAENLFPDLPPY